MNVDKEIEKLSEKEFDLKAMIELKTDKDIIKKQKQQIAHQKLKISKMIDNIK